MRTAFLLLLLPAAVLAATITVTPLGGTATQIVVSYTATTAAACTLTAVDENGGPTVNDVDATKFANSNLDLSRTVANGYRWPTLCDGLPCSASNTGRHRTVTIGGHAQVLGGNAGESERPSVDSSWSSTALQANSGHQITVACNGGADTGTVYATTSNIPIGSYYPEQKIPAGITGPMSGMAQPTIDWTRSGRTAKYIDPMSGLLITRITGPGDNYGDAPSQNLNNPTPQPMDGAGWIAVGGATKTIDPSGAWTNAPSGGYNPTSNTAPLVFASTSTQNAHLHLPWNIGQTSVWNSVDLDDVQVRVYGSSSGSTQNAVVCFSVDGGQTCANSGITIPVTTSSSLQATIPSSFPSQYFSAWGGMPDAAALQYDLTNYAYNGVSISGSTVTLSGFTLSASGGPPGFNIDRKAGSPFLLYNCSSGGPLTLHVAHNNSIVSIATQETGQSASNCTYQDLAAGIDVYKASSSGGTLNIAVASLGWVYSKAPTAGSNGVKWIFSRAKVSDIAVDCDGVSHSPPLSGFLAFFVNAGIYLIQDNGRVCLQSNGYHFPGPSHFEGIGNGSGSPWIDSRTLIGVDQGGTAWKLTHQANDYTEFNGGFPHANVPDNFSWFNLTAGTTPIDTQIKSALPTSAVGRALLSGLWGGTPPAETVIESPAAPSGAALQYRWTVDSGMCITAYADAATNVLSAVHAAWAGGKGTGGAVCHFSPVGIGGYSYVDYRDSDNTIGTHKFNSAYNFGGPFISGGVGVHRPDGSFATKVLSVSACVAAPAPTPPATFPPLGVALCTSAGNDLDNVDAPAVSNGFSGAQATIGGATSGWSSINGVKYLHAVDSNTFAIYSDNLGTPVNATGFGAFSGAVTATTMAPLYTLQISTLTNNGGNARVQANLSASGYVTYFPSASPMLDGDPIGFAGPTGQDFSTGYFAKLCGAGCFDVYSDSALTTPVAFSALSSIAVANSFVTFAETCPDPNTVDTSWFFADIGIGAHLSPKARCVTIRVNTEPCSNYASTGEQSAYPCPSDPSNVTRSSLHNIVVGNGFFDLSHAGFTHEIFGVLSVNKASETQIDVTLIREYGGLLGGACVNCYTDLFGSQHRAGWTPWQYGTLIQGMVPVAGAGFVPDTVPSYIEVGHTDFGLGATTGNLTYSGTYSPAQPDPLFNLPAATAFKTPTTNLSNNTPRWLGDSAHPLELGQSYTTMRSVPGVADPADLVWNSNWAAMNISNGTSGNSFDGGWCSRSFVLQAGRSNVYKIGTCGTVTLKTYPMLVYHGEHGYLTDKSGPGSVLSDADLGFYCVSNATNECVTGSSVGDVFVSVRPFFEFGACISNSATLGATCAIVPPSYGGRALQMRIQPLVYDGSQIRLLSLGLSTIPTQQFTFKYFQQSPDAHWAVWWENPMGGRPYWLQRTGDHWFMAKLPPWIPDSVVRSQWVQVPITLSGRSGDTVRAQFWYGENGWTGSSGNGCMTRAEACWTSTVTSASSPYVFASETQHPLACGTGCMLTIPAIPGRLLYYRVERTNGASVALGPVQMAVVP